MFVASQTLLISLISICAVLLSGALSAFVTYKVTTRTITAASAEGTKQREHDSFERGQDRAHERDLSLGRLLQERKRGAYIVIQRYLAYWESYAQAHSTAFVLTPGYVNPDPPVIGEEADAIANLMASSAVIEGVKSLQGHLSTLDLELRTAKDYRSSFEQGVPGAREDAADALKRSRQAAQNALATIEETRGHMRNELLTGSHS